MKRELWSRLGYLLIKEIVRKSLEGGEMAVEDVSGLVQRLRGLEQRKEAIFLELEELAKVEPSRVELLKQRIRQLIGEFKEELRIIEEMVQNSRKGGEEG